MGQRGGAQAGHQPAGLDVLTGKVGLRKDVVVLAGRLHQLFPPGRGQSGLGLGEGAAHHALALGLLVEVQALHGQQIDQAGEILALADRDGHGHRIGGQFFAHGPDGPLEIRAQPVELVDAGELGHAVGHGLAPDRLGLGLHPGHAAEHAHGPVQHPQGPLHLDGEVHVARGCR